MGEGRGEGDVRGSPRSMGRGNGRRSSHVRQTNSPSGLGVFAAFPFLVPSRTGRGSKAAKPQSREGDGPQEGGYDYSRPVEFPEPALLPSPASWLKGFVGFVRFVVQRSEVR